MRGMKDMAALQKAIDEIMHMSMEVDTLEEARERSLYAVGLWTKRIIQLNDGVENVV